MADNLSRHARPGYSLLEAIIATAILAASAMLLATMIANGSRAILTAEERTHGAAIVSSLIDETIALRLFEPTEREGVIGTEPTWAYRVTVEPVESYGMLRIIAEALPVSDDQSDPWSDNSMSTRTIRLIRWTRDTTQSGGSQEVGGSARSNAGVLESRP